MSETKKNQPAKVYLVGAGPGDPLLMTLRAVEVLEACELVLYDRLLDEACLQYAKQAELISVGKKPGEGTKDKQQEYIISLLIRYSYEGRKVVRLKGGDPFIFGRGGEEALALANSKIPFELVPGLSSFYAAPAMAGIPLTHRNLSNSFGVFTAHSCKGKEEGGGKEEGIDWERAAKLPTAVFLMGFNNLGEILKNLRKEGRKAETPIALISRASFRDQDTVVGTLENIEEKIEKRQEGGKRLKSPVSIVVGEVVCLRDKLEHFLSPLDSLT